MIIVDHAHERHRCIFVDQKIGMIQRKRAIQRVHEEEGKRRKSKVQKVVNSSIIVLARGHDHDIIAIFLVWDSEFTNLRYSR